MLQSDALTATWPCGRLKQSSATPKPRRKSSTTFSMSRASSPATCLWNCGRSELAADVSKRRSMWCGRRPKQKEFRSKWILDPNPLRFPATRTGCSRCSGICFQTRSSSRRPAEKSPSNFSRVKDRFEIEVTDTGQGIIRSFCRLFSIDFVRQTALRPDNTAGWVWDWRSRDTWLRFTAVNFRSTAMAKAQALRLLCGCRWRGDRGTA